MHGLSMMDVLNELLVKRFRKRKGNKMFQAKQNEDRGVFGCKLVPDDLEGFKKTGEFFVDSSGFGKKGEPALTPDEFLEEVKKDRYYAITDQGQFQLYVGEFVKI